MFMSFQNEFWKDHFCFYTSLSALIKARKSCFSEYCKNTDRDATHYRDGSSSWNSDFERIVGIAGESHPISDFIETRIATSIQKRLRIAWELNYVTFFHRDWHRDLHRLTTPMQLTSATLFFLYCDFLLCDDSIAWEIAAWIAIRIRLFRI